MKTAIITGVTGQDGSYLAELLTANKYKVYGIYRRTSSLNFSRLYNVVKHKNFHLIEGDICDPYFISRLVQSIHPDEYYNLAAQSHVATSFEQPSYTWDATAKGVLNALEAIRNESRETKFYQASSSEMFGKNFVRDENGKAYQDENTAFVPQSPYAIAKLAGHHLVRNYRDSYQMFACSGILFNHESERRGENFVTRKITKWLGEFIANDKDKKFPKLRLGNLDARRDWGHAEDYVKAMWLMLQQKEANDYVVATGETHSIKEFLNAAFFAYDLNWENHVVIDNKFYRPAEVEFLLGDASKARLELGWKPTVNFNELVERMAKSDVAQAELSRSTLQTI